MPMSPAQLAVWRTDIQGRLDALAHQARVIRQTMEAQNIRVWNDKASFTAAWGRITDLVPEDFRPPRAGDLARHIHFAMQHDFDDIERLDVPEIKEAVLRFQRAGEENAIAEQGVLGFDFQTFELVHPLVRDACFEQFQLGNFTIAARLAIELLMDEIRRISGLDGDGATLINSAFADGVGCLVFSEGNTESDGSINRGLKTALNGCYSGIRNPLAHGGEHFSRIECFQILIKCSFFLGRISVRAPVGED